MSNYRIIALASLVLVSGFLLLHPILIYTPIVLETGNTYGNEGVSAQFHVFNLGLRSVKVDAYRGSCTCEAIDGPASLKPFSWSPISVNIKSRGVSGGYRVEILVEASGQSPQRLTIYGNRIIKCRADPESVNLSSLDQVGEGRLQTELEFVFSEPVAADSLAFSTGSDRLKITPVGKLSGDVSRVRMKLDYDGSGLRGSFNDWIKVNYAMGQPNDYVVQVRGRLPGGLEIDPEQIDLSALARSANAQIHLSITGLEAGEKIENIQFSDSESRKNVTWSTDSHGNLDIALLKAKGESIPPFSMLARTNKGQTAAVYFAR